MKTRLIHHLLTALLSVAFATALHAQPTAFTYQGQLTDNGAPADGLFDITFTLYDSSGGPTVVGGPVTNAATAAANGMFTVTLDFGAGVFDGSERWLEIGVVTNGGGSSVTLLPRQHATGRGDGHGSEHCEQLHHLRPTRGWGDGGQLE